MTAQKKRYVKVDCADCNAMVKAELIAEHETKHIEDSFWAHLPESSYKLAICPSNHLLLAQSDWQGEDGDGANIWSASKRVWPQPEKETNKLFPEIVRISVEEAEKCHKASAFIASAVMCGRALEGICRHFKTKSNTLYKGLDELLKQGIIDERLNEWGHSLRSLRNLAAHATDKVFSKEDA